MVLTRLACNKEMGLVQVVKKFGAINGFLNNSLDRILGA
jgi:hypothetical protein